MIPNITEEIVEKQKSLQSGTCLGFGLGFKIPLIIKMEMPDPAPLSGNCDVVKIWNDTNSSAGTGTHTSEPVMKPVDNTVVELPEVPVIEPSQIKAETPEKFDDSFIVKDVPKENDGIGEITVPTQSIDTSPILVIEDDDDDEPNFDDE